MEATIAVMIISGALISVYSHQVKRDVDPVRRYNNIQGQILADVSERSDLRLDVLNVKREDFGDGNFTALNNFIESKIPKGFGYSIRVCDLGDSTDHCLMRAPVFIATMDKDIYAEEIIVSAEVGDGTNAVYNPKKLKLFVWQGQRVGTDCTDECPKEGTVLGCSSDGKRVTKNVCGNFDNDFCLEYNGTPKDVKTCGKGEVCVEGLGICSKKISGTYNLTCEKRRVVKTGCVSHFDDECDAYDGGERVRGCGFFWHKDEYECYNVTDTKVTKCSKNPKCPAGLYPVDINSCCLDTGVWRPSRSSVCSGKRFTQKTNCGRKRIATGTKDCSPRSECKKDRDCRSHSNGHCVHGRCEYYECKEDRDCRSHSNGKCHHGRCEYSDGEDRLGKTIACKKTERKWGCVYDFSVGKDCPGYDVGNTNGDCGGCHYSFGHVSLKKKCKKNYECVKSTYKWTECSAAKPSCPSSEWSKVDGPYDCKL